MLELSKNSWHYKLVTKQGIYLDRGTWTLCKYFWTVVGIVLFRISLGLLFDLYDSIVKRMHIKHRLWVSFTIITVCTILISHWLMIGYSEMPVKQYDEETGKPLVTMEWSDDFGYRALWATLLYIGVATSYIIWSCFFIAFVADWYDDYLARGISNRAPRDDPERHDSYWRKRRENRKKKNPNLLIEFLKSNKQKVCPLIQFINEEEDNLTQGGEGSRRSDISGGSSE